MAARENYIKVASWVLNCTKKNPCFLMAYALATCFCPFL